RRGLALRLRRAARARSRDPGPAPLRALREGVPLRRDVALSESAHSKRPMKAAVVGGGVLGLTLAHRLAQKGHSVDLLEAEPALGGLAQAHDYGPFVWDRFYHCILPQDTSLIALLAEMGLENDLRWTKTGTGYYARGRMYDMNGNADFLRFPLLTLV